MAGVLETVQLVSHTWKFTAIWWRCMNIMEIHSFVAMLFIIRRHVDTKMGSGWPSTFTTDDACHADALIRQDMYIKLRDTARQQDILLGCVHSTAKEQLDYIKVCMLGAKAYKAQHIRLSATCVTYYARTGFSAVHCYGRWNMGQLCETRTWKTRMWKQPSSPSKEIQRSNICKKDCGNCL